MLRKAGWVGIISIFVSKFSVRVRRTTSNPSYQTVVHLTPPTHYHITLSDLNSTSILKVWPIMTSNDLISTRVSTTERFLCVWLFVVFCLYNSPWQCQPPLHHPGQTPILPLPMYAMADGTGHWSYKAQPYINRQISAKAKIASDRTPECIDTLTTCWLR